jgi:hypothetical protein
VTTKCDSGAYEFQHPTDTTAPTTKISLDPSTPNGKNDWYTSAVTLSVSAKDPDDAAAALQTRCILDPSSPPANFAALPSTPCPYLSPTGASVGSDGTHTLYAASIDPAGNAEAVNTQPFKIDTTPPTIAPSATKADGTTYTAGTWTNQSVTVHFNCHDVISGIATCAADQTLSAEGATSSISGKAINEAGNSATTGFGPIQIDKTAPTVTYTGNAGSYTVDQQVQITCTPNDSLSGVATSTCQNISGPAYSFGLGTHPYSATATDNAGNIGSQSTSFKVTVTPSSLTSLINRFCTDPSVAASLDQDVANIAHAPNANAKAGMLQGFTQLVQAQTGKSLTSDQAKVLITLAGAL